MRSEGSSRLRRISRRKLVFGRLVEVLTMMQSYASAAKPPGGGAILPVGNASAIACGACTARGGVSVAWLPLLTRRAGDGKLWYCFSTSTPFVIASVGSAAGFSKLSRRGTLYDHRPPFSDSLISPV